MIDYFMKFTNEANAITAAQAYGKLGRYVDSVWQWDVDYVHPNIKTWRISQDTVGGDGQVIHQYLAGWYCIVSTVNANSTLSNHANLAIELNRDGPPYLRKNNTGIAASDLNFEPVFTGSHYPTGGIS